MYIYTKYILKNFGKQTVFVITWTNKHLKHFFKLFYVAHKKKRFGIIQVWNDMSIKRHEN